MVETGVELRGVFEKEKKKKKFSPAILLSSFLRKRNRELIKP